MAQPEQYIIHFTDPSKSSFIVSPYTSNGRTFPISGQLDSQAISATSSLLLYGKGSANYGERIQENLLHILENFSGATVPVLPISGQLWFSRREYWRTTSTTSGWYRWNDTTSSWDALTVGYAQAGDPGAVGDGIYWFDTSSSTLKRRVEDANHPLNNTWVSVINTGYDGSPVPTVNDTPEKDIKVYNGESWVPVSSNAYASATAPNSPVTGDLWYDTNPADDPWSNNQLKVWDGSAWVSSGGNYVVRSGDSMTGDLTMTGANINIDASQGLIGNVTGSPLGDGATLTLTSNGFTWEAQAGDTTGSGFIVKNSVGATVLTVGATDADPTSTFAGDIQTSGNEVLGLPALPSGATAATSKAYVDTLIGGTPASINDLLDVHVPSPVHDEFLYYDNVGSPTGQWKSKPAAPLNSPGFTGLPTAPTAGPGTDTLQLATTAFVQQELSGAGGVGDGVVTGGSFDTGTYELALETRIGGTGSPPGLVPVSLVHTHPATDITHDITDSLIRDGFIGGSPLYYLGAGSPPDPLQANIGEVVEHLSKEIKLRTTRQIRDQIVLRQEFRLTSPQSEFLIDNDETFTSGYNRLQVFVNGVKQYINGRARQAINLREEFLGEDYNVSASSWTGLPNDATSYSFTVAIDGQATGSPQTPQTVNVTGSQVQTVQDIIDQINAQVTGATCVWDPRWTAIWIFSDASGVGSSVKIDDVDFFSALASAPATTLGTPLYDVGNISPDYPGILVQIDYDGAYYEARVPAGSPLTFVETKTGEIGEGVVFNSALPAGSVVEFLIT